ncbi:MAG: AmmeMemoRadiSam system radical SAM enzyme [Candidatus Eisenbacteria bacterium]
MAEVHSALYETLQDGSARCVICERRCVIREGGWGWCCTRKNRRGRIYGTVFGEVSTKMIAPIEAKPIFHFLPGSKWLSLGSLGCNMRCIGCQNWEIAHEKPCEIAAGRTQFMEPREVVALAKQENVTGISWTYNEPTMWLEYTVRTSVLAKKEGLLTTYVTNGYMTKAALDLIGPHVDVFRVDIKGFSQEFYSKVAAVDDYQPILENALRAKSRWDMHVEVVTNVIPGLNDSDVEMGRLATWIATGLGKRTPWHVTRFMPYRDLENVPCTPVETLDRIRQIGFDVGLLYVYTGNVPGHPGENTYCPKCGRVVIGRYHFSLIANNLVIESDPGNHGDHGDHGTARCKYCGQRITGVFG